MNKTKITFEFCGLNKENNFLQAPKCECGCGGYAGLILETDNDVCSFMHTMLEEHDCEHCGIFAFKKNSADMLMGLKLDGEIKCYEVQVQGGSEGPLVDIQNELKLHCYGILEQVDNDLYSIVMD